MGKNRLSREKSPYLLQHAENPVDWYPWGNEAFERAKREDRPVFLSIGYSTCHWCHVMAHESFEDPAVARLMNDTFINIKVDREERPDIDKLYMSVCQMVTGSGGWPLTIVMTPDRKPFYAATYLPRENRYGRAGMMELVPRLGEIWMQRRREIDRAASDIIGALNRENRPGAGQTAGIDLFHRAFHHLESLYDREHGGFGTAPKFPMAHHLLFLLRYWNRTGNRQALSMVVHSLAAMRLGGLYDHAGGGFHRYSTDEEWIVPHFEKMLYDQALLAMAYMEAFQATGNLLFGETARAVLRYVLRDLAAPDGGYCCAEDADSEGEEGKFYLWTSEELRRFLTEEELALFRKFYAVEEGGNFTDEATGIKKKENILFSRPGERGNPPLSDPAGAEGEKIGRILENLRHEREKRVRPHRDDKVLTDWNGLMIAAFAMGGRIFADEDFTTAARKGAAFILGKLSPAPGTLLHRYREGESAVPGHLDDYAFFTWGLLELYDTTFDPSFLRKALGLMDEVLKSFMDEDRGDFYFTSRKSEVLPARQKDAADGALPSGTAVTILNLVRLGLLLGRTGLLDRAHAALSTLSETIGQSPAGHTMCLAGMDNLLFSTFQAVAAAKERKDESLEGLIRQFRSRYLPHGMVLLLTPEKPFREIATMAPYLSGMALPEEGVVLYPCIRGACLLPIRSAGELESFLEKEGRPKTTAA